MYVELIAIPAITMPGSGVIIAGRNTACSAITCCRLMYCDTLSPHNVLVTQQTLAQNKTSRTREVRESRAYFKISPAKVPTIYRRILRTILLTSVEFVGRNPHDLLLFVVARRFSTIIFYRENRPQKLFISINQTKTKRTLFQNL